MGKLRTNRVQVDYWWVDPNRGPLPFEYLAWKITLVVGANTQLRISTTTNNVYGPSVIVLGGAFDDNGCPILTRFSGYYAINAGQQVMVLCEYLDPDIG